jgi:hypothetical protein
LTWNARVTASAALTALRKRHYVLESLPGTIVIPAFGGLASFEC